MTDAHLILDCARRVVRPTSKFTGWTIRRLCEMARFPKPETLADSDMLYDAQDLIKTLLVRIAKIQGVRKGGLVIKPTCRYRGIDGDVRRVIDVHPHHRDGGVSYICISSTNSIAESLKAGQPLYARMANFKAWAIEEITQ